MATVTLVWGWSCWTGGCLFFLEKKDILPDLERKRDGMAGYGVI